MYDVYMPGNGASREGEIDDKGEEGMTNGKSPKRQEERNSPHKHKISVWRTEEFSIGLREEVKTSVSL